MLDGCMAASAPALAWRLGLGTQSRAPEAAQLRMLLGWCKHKASAARAYRGQAHNSSPPLQCMELGCLCDGCIRLRCLKKQAGRLAPSRATMKLRPSEPLNDAAAHALRQPRGTDFVYDM